MSDVNSFNGNPTETSGLLETHLYSKRWWLVVSIGIETLLFGISLLYFGVNNDVFSEYFGLSYASIDWFYLVNPPALCITSAGFAFLSTLNKTGFRKVAIASGSLMVIGCLCQFIACAFPHLYWFVYMGNFLMGIMGGFMLVVPTSFAVQWFPDNEIGSALSLRLCITRLGILIAFLVPSHLLTPLQCNNDISMAGLTNISAASKHNYTQCRQNWMDEERWTLLGYVGVVMIVGVMTLIFLIIFAMDLPRKPPTIAQARLRLNTQEQTRIQVWKKFKEFVTEAKSLFTDLTFLVIIGIAAVAFAFNLFQGLFIGEIFRPVFRSFYSSSKADMISSYVIVGFEIGGIIGTAIIGLLVDRIKNYVLLLRVFLFFGVLCTIGLVISYYFKCVSAIFITDILSGVSCGTLLVPTYELSTQHTYPQKPEFVVSLLTCGYIVGVTVLTQFGRIVLDQLGGLSLLVFQATFIFTVLLLTMLSKPQYHRLEAETTYQDRFTNIIVPESNNIVPESNNIVPESNNIVPESTPLLACDTDVKSHGNVIPNPLPYN